MFHVQSPFKAMRFSISCSATLSVFIRRKDPYFPFEIKDRLVMDYTERRFPCLPHSFASSRSGSATTAV